MKTKLKILAVKVERKVDEQPDTSHSGEYTDDATDWAIDRNSGEYLGLMPSDAEWTPKGREFRFFKPYAGGEPEGTAAYREYGKQDFQRMESLQRGEWCFIGIIAKAEVWNSVTKVTQVVRSGGLWGIESDSDKDYLQSVGADELENLRSELLALGFGERAIEHAFKTVETVNS